MGAAHYTTILAQNSEYLPDTAILNSTFSSTPQSTSYLGNAGGELYNKRSMLGLDKGSMLGLNKGGRLSFDTIDSRVSTTLPFKSNIGLPDNNKASYVGTEMLRY